MRATDSSRGGGARQYRITRWTHEMDCVHGQIRTGRAALAAFCQTYCHPFYTFSRRSGYSPPDAEDLTHRSSLHLLEHRALRQAYRLKGKFQGFLRACFQNYLSVEAQRASALKQGGRCQVVSVDLENAENPYRLEQVDHLTAERIFEARWAPTLLNRVTTFLWQEHLSRGKELIFDTLKKYVGIGESKPEASYHEAVKALGVGLGTAKTLIYRLRKRFFAVVREEGERTVSNPAEIDEKIRALSDELIAAEGRVKP